MNCRGPYSWFRRSQVASGSTFIKWRKTLWREARCEWARQRTEKRGRKEGCCSPQRLFTEFSEKKLITV
jgi:hypothetical protein